MTRTQLLIGLARYLKVSDETLVDLMQEALDSDPLTVQPNSHRAVAVLIDNLFSGDDDYDEFRHELDHDLGHCSDADEDCVWRVDDED